MTNWSRQTGEKELIRLRYLIIKGFMLAPSQTTKYRLYKDEPERIQLFVFKIGRQ